MLLCCGGEKASLLLRGGVAVCFTEVWQFASRRCGSLLHGGVAVCELLQRWLCKRWRRNWCSHGCCVRKKMVARFVVAALVQFLCGDGGGAVVAADVGGCRRASSRWCSLQVRERRRWWRCHGSDLLLFWLLLQMELRWWCCRGALVGKKTNSCFDGGRWWRNSGGGGCRGGWTERRKLGLGFWEMKMMTWQPSIGQLVSARIVATWLALVG